ncbi:10729_t:CDS:1, partial [Dentiscutata erythropus]
LAWQHKASIFAYKCYQLCVVGFLLLFGMFLYTIPPQIEELVLVELG